MEKEAGLIAGIGLLANSGKLSMDSRNVNNDLSVPTVGQIFPRPFK